MALVLNDRVKETTTTTGQGTISLGGAATGFETFVTGVGDTNTTYYIIVHESDGTWEIGIGTIGDASPDTLARTTVIDTSAGNTTKIDFAAGSKTVFCTLPSSKAVFLDADGDVTLGANLSVGGNLDVTGSFDMSDANITNIGSIALDTITNDGTDITLDSSGDIILDAGGADIFLKDDGTEIGKINFDSSDLKIASSVSDKNIVFQGNDGGVTITALTLDMSDVGTASFLHDIKLGDNSKALFGAGSDLEIYHDGSNSFISDIGTGDFKITSNGNGISLQKSTSETMAFFDTDGPVHLYHDNSEKFVTTSGGVSITGEVAATSLDISGDADIDGTLEADAITVNGTALSSVIAGTTVTLASTVTVTDSTANTNFPVVFHNESNGLLDDTGALRYNPSTGELLVPNLTVAGTTTTVDTVTMQAENAIVFEGATADAHETTLTIIDPTDDRTINLPNVSGTIPVLAAVSATQITSTPEELNILDGVTSTAAELNILDGVTSTAAELNILDGVTSTAAELNVLDGITAVVGELNALDLGSTAVGTAIASKAVILDSNKDYTGIRNLTITGELDGATLDISGNADIDGTLEADAITIGGTSTDTLYASPGFAVAMAIAL